MLSRFCFFLLIVLSGCAVFKKDPTRGNPPGTLKINDTLYIDQTEMTNVGWREYFYYVRRFDSANEYKALPDTLVWRDSLYYCEPLVEYYFRHPSFNNYPVVGVSYEQAVEYCKWRTFVVNLGLYMDENKLQKFEDHLNDSFPIKLYYRLPTKEEWEMIASAGIDSNNRRFKKFKPKEIFNYHVKQTIDSLRKKQDPNLPEDVLFTVDVKAYYKNKWGAYNMIGNVGEMVLEKGVAKGGSYIHPLDSCRVWMNQTYSDPQHWLGFRCVAVKIK